MPRVSITIPGKNSQPYRFQLDREKVKIGRGSENDIVIDCPSVSSFHCTMERVPGGYILRDRKSTNGIELDEEEMDIIDLRNDIDVKVGDVKFDYTLTDDELDELDEEEFVPHAKKASARTEDPEPDEKPKKKKALRKMATSPPPRSVSAPPPPLASSSEGSGFLYGLALLVCGLLAFYAGMDHSYTGKQEDAGREGDISLLSDIKNGRDPIEKSEEE